MSTPPTPPDSVPQYLAEELQKQNAETLTDIESYIQKLRLYRAAEVHTARSLAAETHDVDPATVDEFAAKAHEEGIPEDAINWDEICAKGVPATASIVVKTIDDTQYYYIQWREGEQIKSEFLAPVSPQQ